MNRPDGMYTRATIIVMSDKLSERELEIELAERMKGLEVEVTVERILVDNAEKGFKP